MSEIFLGRSVQRNSPADYERSGPGGELAGSIAESVTPGYGLFKNIGGMFQGRGSSGRPAIKEDEFRKTVKAKLDKEAKVKK